MTKKSHKNWNEKEEVKLVELYNQGLKDSEIAQQLNRSKDSVKHRVALLKARKELVGKRRNKSMEDNYYAPAKAIIDKFKNKKHKKKISEANYNLICDMDQHNQADDLSFNTRANYIRFLYELGLYLNKKPFDKISLEKDVEPFVIQLKKRLNKETAYQSYKSCFKCFFRYLMTYKFPDKKNILEVFNYFNRKKRSKKREHMEEVREHFNRREIVKLVSSIKGNSLNAIRERALLSVTYDSGGRISEVLAVRQRDADTDGKVPRLFFHLSKTEPRYCHMLKFSLPYLMDWIKVHEFWNNPDAPLFYSMSTSNYGEPLSRSSAGQILRRALKLSKITKKLTLHGLRHSKAYHCAEQGMMVTEANKLFGWSKTSGMFHYYSAIADKELQLKELERAGKLTPEQLEERKLERNAFVMKSCPRCKNKSTPDQFVCSKCGLSLNKESAKKELELMEKIDSLESNQDKMLEALEAKIAAKILKKLGVQKL